jgi:hypothetical protein
MSIVSAERDRKRIRDLKPKKESSRTNELPI